MDTSKFTEIIIEMITEYSIENNLSNINVQSVLDYVGNTLKDSQCYYEVIEKIKRDKK